MKIKSMFASKKIGLVVLFVASAIATLLMFNQPRAIAQGVNLNDVRNASASSCRKYGSQCSSCASNLAKNYIKQSGITDQRTQQAIFNAAISGCS
ncbi:hypothetical protein I4641_11875 [Waterburya agarophytonicola K14]|uniref:Uncharacterized protein n=1 Tax=Waterburya agarophytonicola KI4 TaxID=2874699 RepID=A0A964BT36_9CYAN|nr:hypothetical protein [Waterburya agarophytonicola]MCC0177677.1 hypothetical protein [Waterburya agarophytonicola KI4]